MARTEHLGVRPPHEADQLISELVGLGYASRTQVARAMLAVATRYRDEVVRALPTDRSTPCPN